MEKIKGAIYLKISGIFALVVGILYTVMIVTAAIGIPLIVGGAKLMGYSEMTKDEYEKVKGSALGWSIFFVFVALVPGVLGIVGAVMSDEDKQDSVNNEQKQEPMVAENKQNSVNGEQKQEPIGVENQVKNTEQVQQENKPLKDSLTDKIERLYLLKKRGVITDEEFAILKTKYIKEDK